MDLTVAVIYIIFFYIIGGVVVMKANKDIRSYYFMTIPLSFVMACLFYISPSWWGDNGPQVFTAILAGFATISTFGLCMLVWYGVILKWKWDARRETEKESRKK